MIIEITDKNFSTEVETSDKPVLVDFWAAWCGPCKMLAPVIDQIAQENEEIKVGKVNIDDQMELASRFGVMSIPTLILFKNGQPAGTMVGVQPKSAIEDLIKG